MHRIYLPVGMIGSGKSTWARKFIAENSSVRIVAGDDIRLMLGGGAYEYDPILEPAVIDILMQATETALEYGLDVILDECYCSLSIAMRKRVMELFCDYTVIAVVFPEKGMKDRIEDKVTKGLRGKTVSYWKRVFTEMAEVYEPVSGAEGFHTIMRIT